MNWLKRSTEFILQTRWHALGFAVLFTVVPFFSWLAAVIVCMVTLRKGELEGAGILVGVAVLVNLLFFALGHAAMMPLGLVLAFISAVALARSQSWIITVEVTSLVCVLGVIIAHLAVPNLQQTWQHLLSQHFDEMKAITPMKITAEQANALFVVLSKVLTGMIAVFSLITGLVNLFIARWIQSLSDTSITLRENLINLRIDWIMIIVLASVIGSLYLHFAGVFDLVAVVALPFILVGISLVHFFANKLRFALVALCGFYLLLMAFAHYALGLLIVLALIDRLFDLRGYSDGRHSTRKNS